MLRLPLKTKAFSALLFLYQEVLKERLPWIDDIVRAKWPPKLPVVFTQAEARAVLSGMHRTPLLMAYLLYGSDAHRDGKRFIVRADEELTAFLELEIDGFGQRVIFELPAVDLSKKATPPPSLPRVGSSFIANHAGARSCGTIGTAKPCVESNQPNQRAHWL
jgi:hypothetical protein